MTSLRNAIIATLIYHDIFDYPLTAVEVWSYLINPTRVDRQVRGVDVITLTDVVTTLDALVHVQRIGMRNGYYMVSIARQSLYDLRIAREKVSAQKWKKLLRKGYWFQLVPYVRALCVSGSLALENSDADGDFDMFTIVQSGRLYTVRLLLSLVASLLRARRRKEDTIAPDKFCLNHYITQNHLRIEAESLYTAHTFSQMIPISGDRNVMRDFYSHNKWITKYLYNFQPEAAMYRSVAQPSVVIRTIHQLGEWLLRGRIGDLIERKVRQYQQRRIRTNDSRYRRGGRIVVSDTALEFHPHSFESTVIRMYTEATRQAQLPLPFLEKDSGLIDQVL